MNWLSEHFSSFTFKESSSKFESRFLPSQAATFTLVVVVFHQEVAVLKPQYLRQWGSPQGHATKTLLVKYDHLSHESN